MQITMIVTKYVVRLEIYNIVRYKLKRSILVQFYEESSVYVFLYIAF